MVTTATAAASDRQLNKGQVGAGQPAGADPFSRGCQGAIAAQGATHPSAAAGQEPTCGTAPTLLPACRRGAASSWLAAPRHLPAATPLPSAAGERESSGHKGRRAARAWRSAARCGGGGKAHWPGWLGGARHHWYRNWHPAESAEDPNWAAIASLGGKVTTGPARCLACGSSSSCKRRLLASIR